MSRRAPPAGPARILRCRRRRRTAPSFGPEPFTGPEAVRTGLNRDRLRDLVGTGRVRRLLHGVYVDARVA